MANKRINDFFNGRLFEVPKYQRGYAWEKRHVRELFDDIFESIETNSSHYIGTMVLSEKGDSYNSYYIVDGQQRIATLLMIVNVIIKYFKRSDKDYYHRFYVEEEGLVRLKPLGKDSAFFINLLKNGKKEPRNKSQKLLKEAYQEIQDQIKGIEDKKRFLTSIERLEVMEFIEKSEGDAIRIFQTVNDRGKPLSNMEKAKSLLIYFSNRYLNKKLDAEINDKFGDIFELYDEIKDIGEQSDINLISNVDFNEDNIMRYHFVTFSDENYDATASYVLEYLKRELGDYREKDKSNKFSNMEKFIVNYVSNLHDFFYCLRDVLKRIKSREKYYKIFCILGVSATLYPLIGKLEMLGRLQKKLPSPQYKTRTFLDLIELVDVRVYKTRGTDPRAEISRFAKDIDKNWADEQIEEWLLWFNERWMSKEEFQTHLNANFYGNRALPHIFIEYCETLKNGKYSLEALRKFMSKRPTVEHVLAQTPNFRYKSFGFRGEEDFLEYSDKIGNLTILEKSINSAVQNKNPIDKIPYYDRSAYRMTKALSSSLAHLKRFDKKEIAQRTTELSQYCLKRWW